MKLSREILDWVLITVTAGCFWWAWLLCPQQDTATIKAPDVEVAAEG